MTPFQTQAAEIARLLGMRAEMLNGLFTIRKRTWREFFRDLFRR